MMMMIHTGQAPQYLSNCVSTISSSGNRYRLRSCDMADYILPKTRTKFGERGFHYSGPAAWNTLPSDLHDITDTNVFKKRLKLFCLIVRTDLLQISYCICILYFAYSKSRRGPKTDKKHNFYREASIEQDTLGSVSQK